MRIQVLLHEKNIPYAHWQNISDTSDERFSATVINMMLDGEIYAPNKAQGTLYRIA